MVMATVKKVVNIPDGTHIGTISELEVRKTEEYGEYLDMNVKFADVPDAELSFGMPLTVSVKSDLGKLLMAMGFNVEKHENKQIDLDKILLGQVITFFTKVEKVERDGKKMEFARIVKDTISIADQKKQ